MNLMSTEEVAKHFNRRPATVNRWARRGQLNPKKGGGKGSAMQFDKRTVFAFSPPPRGNPLFKDPKWSKHKPWRSKGRLGLKLTKPQIRVLEGIIDGTIKEIIIGSKMALSFNALVRKGAVKSTRTWVESTGSGVASQKNILGGIGPENKST